jgi:UDP-glucuronate 4-epimerase
MAPFLFTEAILNNKPIKVFNQGDLMRDFTYIDDIVQGILGILKSDKIKDCYSIFNLGNNTPVKLLDFIQILELECGKKAIFDLLPMQEGDVYQTYADIDKINEFVEYNPNIKIEQGIREFVNWYKTYYNK